MAAEIKTRLSGDESDLKRSYKSAEDAGDRWKRSLKGVSGELSNLGSGIGSTALKLGKFAATGGVLAGTAIAAGLGKGFSDALSQKALTGKLSAALGLDPAEAAEAGKLAGDVYAGAWGDSLEQVNQSINVLVKQGLVTSDDLGSAAAKEATTDLLDLATVMEKDVGEAAEAAGGLVRNGLAANAEEAFDLLAAGQTNNLNRADDLLDTLREYSPAFERMGFTGRQVFAILESGLNAGAYDTDIIGDAIKEFGVRAIDGSEATAQAFKDAGLDAKALATDIAAGGPAANEAFRTTIAGLRDIDDLLIQDAAGAALFGGLWESMGAEALLALNPISGKFDDIGEASENLSDTLNSNLQVRLESLKRKGFMALADLASVTVIPALEKAMPHIERFADGVVDAFSVWGDPDVTNKAEVFADKIDELFGGTGRLSGPIESFIGFMETIPGRTTAAIESIKDFFGSPEAKEAASEFGRLVDNLSEKLSALAEKFDSPETDGTGEGFFESLARNVSGGLDFFNDMLEGSWDQVTDSSVQAIKAMGREIAFAAGLIGKPLWSAFKRGVMLEWDNIKGVFTSIGQQISDWFNSLDRFSIGGLVPSLGSPGGSSGRGAGRKAAGGSVQQAGVFDVGEIGPERVFLPAGAFVQPAHQAAAAGAGAPVVNVRVDTGGVFTDGRDLAEFIEQGIRQGMAGLRGPI